MEGRTEEFIAYLNLLGIKIDSSNFEHRIKAQKLAYIIQKLVGKELYPDFNFYIKGPYSPELAKEYFDRKEDFANGSSKKKLSEGDINKLSHAIQLLKRLDPKELEVVASLLWLKEKGFDETQSENKLHELKPYLKMEEIWKGSNTLKKLLLNEKLRASIMDSLKNETRDWDKLSNETLEKLEQ
ncbi:MAG: hypothetical protein M1544_01370 [Candidatus Marsarchaeota archaeon]|nr:hypothetical protein [Candidatus Marsarchaeota archaeon]